MKCDNKYLLFALLASMSCRDTGSHAKEPQASQAAREFAKKAVVDRVNEIVLVNAANIDRCEIGHLIRKISKCTPAVVGINFLFPEEKDGICDSTLQASIIDSDRVVLAEGFDDGNYVDLTGNLRKCHF